MKLVSADLRRVGLAAIVAILTLAAITLQGTTASAWYDSRLPPGCTFTASPGTPYKSGGRIYSKVTFTIRGCNGLTFNRTHAISEASTPDAALPYYRDDAPGVVPDSVTRTMSMPCKRGNWATTISLQFSDGWHYAFAQGGILSVTSC